MSAMPLVSLGTRSDANERNAMYRPSGVIAPSKLSPLPGNPPGVRLTYELLGVCALAVVMAPQSAKSKVAKTSGARLRLANHRRLRVPHFAAVTASWSIWPDTREGCINDPLAVALEKTTR